MDQTTHYKLNKPTLDEQYDLSAINDNTDKIDTTMHNIQTELDADEKDLVAKNKALNERIDETNSALNSEISNRENAVIDSAHGGSGKTTLKASANAFIGSLESATGSITDDSCFITSSDSSDKGIYYKRKASPVWDWIKSKISSVLGLTESKYNGTSEKAIKDNSGNTITTEYANKPYANDILSRYSTTVNIDYATTGNIKLSGVQTIDGISIAPQKTVLVKNQTNAKENGIYESSNTTWKRLATYDTDGELKHKLFRILNGSSNRNKVFYIPFEYFTLGTSNILFSEYTKIETEQIADEQITSSKIKNGNVTSNELGTDSVITSKIKNGNVTKEKLNGKIITDFTNEVREKGETYLQFYGKPTPQALFGGTWKNISNEFAGAYISVAGGNVGQAQAGVIAEGLPNVTGTVTQSIFSTSGNSDNGQFEAFYGSFYGQEVTAKKIPYISLNKGAYKGYKTLIMDASRVSGVYGSSDHVTPEHCITVLWEKISD